MALLLTWRTYGTWLPGDARGYMDETRNAHGEPFKGADVFLENAARGQMAQAPFELSPSLRLTADRCLREACKFRDWTLLALNVRTNHVHVVVATGGSSKGLIETLKARVTRVLREEGVVAPEQKVWARGGSARLLWDEEGVAAAVDYVLNRQ
jgi:REP element-mobilizing transposase RayT